ncbi:F-box protein At1g80960 isoform X4 [Brassica rapa]|uniref:F-box protein At1g80960 isoform X4 n=1 Tax=Brassica campestris TaxID=3711 RepID=UPI0004F197AD|nr:F-box protein At1g80960 isoform X4 [Brassica rapa]
MVHVEVINTDDYISKLSNDLLLEILSKSSTEEVIKTSILSKRWRNVWKKTSCLCLDMRRIEKTTTLLPGVFHQAANSVTKVIQDHCGHLERCTIYHDSRQCENGMLEFWIQSLVNVKHIKDLTLENFSPGSKSNNRSNVTLDLPPRIKGVEVSSPSLDIISIGSLSCEMENFIIASPRLHFNRNYWATGKFFPHTSYYISCPYQGEASIGHEIMMNGSNVCMKMFASMSVSVDLTNAKEVEILRQVLAVWPGDMQEVEILFKSNNAARKESESSIGNTQNAFWEDTKPFPSAQFRAYTVWLSNFSGSNEEFALASRMIMQGTVARCMIIKPSTVSPANKLEIEAAIARLKELPKGHENLRIVMF